jgi:lysophospholipase L1-like esterase
MLTRRSFMLEISALAGVLTLSDGVTALAGFDVPRMLSEPQTTRFKIAMLGTSLTSGESLVGGAWQPDLVAAIGAHDGYLFETHNFGIGGGRSTTAISSGAVASAAALHANVATLEFNMNDCVDAPSDPAYVSLAQAQSNIQSIISTLRTGNPTIQIYLMTMNPVIGSAPGVAARHLLPDYDAMYRSLAVSEGVGLIDGAPAWGTPTSTQIPDGIHPTRAAMASVQVPLIAGSVGALLS